MNYKATRDFAEKCDRDDPLRKFRKQFYFPRQDGRETVYLCGHSLGLLSKKVKPAIDTELDDWKNLGIKGYRDAQNPWLVYQHSFDEPLSRLVGSTPGEVTVMNTLTVNLHLLMLSMYTPTPARFKIIMEGGAFPSDQYMVETQARFHGFDPGSAIIELFPREGERLLRTADILEAIDAHKDQLAVVLFSGINYYTGQLFDIPAITQAAHFAGALAGFDLAHVVGNVPLQLHEWDVDFAAWCSYKYLNGGPGAAGGIFVHNKFNDNATLPRLGGWWGNDERTRFEMRKGFVPLPGAAGWNMSTAQVFNMVALKASLKLFDKADHQLLREKSIALTGYLEYLLQTLRMPGLEIITPVDPAARGAQLSIYLGKNCENIFNALLAEGVIVDYRRPDVIRIAPSPLYNSYTDVYRVYKILKKHRL